MISYETEAANINFQGFTTYNAPLLEKAADMFLFNITENLNIPETEIALDIHAPNVKNADIKKLKTVETLDLRSVKNLCADELQSFCTIYAQSATIVYAPKSHKNPYSIIYAFKANEITVSNNFNGTIYCNSRTKIIGNCKNVNRHDNWALFNGTLCIILNRKNNIYHLVNVNNIQEFFAKKTGNQWKTMATIKKLSHPTGNPNALIANVVTKIIGHKFKSENQI